MCGSYKQRAGPVSTMRSRLRLRGQYLALQLGTARARAPRAEELRAVLDAATTSAILGQLRAAHAETRRHIRVFHDLRHMWHGMWCSVRAEIAQVGLAPDF